MAEAGTGKRKARAKKPAPRAPQWNEDRRRAFLQELAATSNVAASERAAGMAPGSAYRLRGRSEEFHTAWGEALAEGYARLELTLLARAIDGIVKRTTRTVEGQQETVEYSDRLGMTLLAAHRATVAGVTAARGEGGSTARERLTRRLSEMNRRLGGEG